MRRAFACLLLVFVALFFGLATKEIGAQSAETSGIAVYIQIGDKKVQEGDIVSLSSKGYVLGTIPYDPNIVGVVVKDPAVAFESDQPGSYPVVSQGKVYMRVSNINGNIKRGDLLTTSTKAGVGQKATESGFIVASALEDYASDKPGKILVVLSVGNGTITTNPTSNLLKIFTFAMNAPYLAPLSVLRYLFAAIMVIISFLLAIGYFGRLSTLGIEALGRNPLAGRTIVFGIVMNIVLALGILSVGIVVAYIVLVI